MPAAAKPKNEEQRAKTLSRLNLLDTLPEQDYDDIVALAAQICDVPISLISLVDRDRQWFKAAVGLDAKETPRELAFCAHAILDANEILEVEDATQDERFADNALVKQRPDIRFYAGYPLKALNGLPLGTLCTIDTKPRKLTEEQRRGLRLLGRMAERLIHKQELALQTKQQQDCLDLAEKQLGIGHWSFEIATEEITWSSGVYKIHGVNPKDYQPEFESAVNFYHPDDRGKVLEIVNEAIARKEGFKFKLRLVRPDGEIRDVMSAGQPQVNDSGAVSMVSGIFMDVTEQG